jgi:HD-like signal output (HDOD) protein/CheY-like chemotaxis protein
MRVMIVDDDAFVLKATSRMLKSTEESWEVLTASSGADALSLLSSAKVDVIVTDMRMPGMDGADLLSEVSKTYPGVIRIVLSGQADKQSVLRAVTPMHQYLAKPCSGELLRSTISRACALREVLDSTTHCEWLTSVSALPILPGPYQQLVEEIESPDGSIKRVGELASRDPAIAAKLLQLANSAYLGLSAPVTSPAQAVSIIGLDALKALVLTVHVFRSFSSGSEREFSIDKIMTHSLRVATICRLIATHERLNDEIVSEGFTAGLLHDIGKLLFISELRDSYKKAIAGNQSGLQVSLSAEREHIGVGHDAIGGYLLTMWGIPQSIVEAVTFHHQPLKPTGDNVDLVSLVAVANLLEHDTHDPIDFDDWLDVDTECERTEWMNRIETWRTLLKSERSIVA